MNHLIFNLSGKIDWGKLPIIHEDWGKECDYKYQKKIY